MHALCSATGTLYDSNVLGRLRSFLERQDKCEHLGPAYAFLDLQEAGCGRHKFRGVSMVQWHAVRLCSADIEHTPTNIWLLVRLAYVAEAQVSTPAIYYVRASRLFRRPGMRRTVIALDMRGAWSTNALHMSAGVHALSGACIQPSGTAARCP